MTSDHQSMRLQNEASSRMSSYTSDLESASPASSGVGSCKELRTVLPLVRSPNRSMEKPLGNSISRLMHVVMISSKKCNSLLQLDVLEELRIDLNNAFFIEIVD